MDIKTFNQQIIEEFRGNGGAVGGQFAGANLLLLTTTGARSGAQRINPLAYTEFNNELIVIASYAGADSNPPWFHNLLANPQVTVEVGTDKFTSSAYVLDEPQRSEAYGKMEESMSAFTEYKNKTNRRIPVIALPRS